MAHGMRHAVLHHLLTHVSHSTHGVQQQHKREWACCSCGTDTSDSDMSCPEPAYDGSCASQNGHARSKFNGALKADHRRM